MGYLVVLVDGNPNLEPDHSRIWRALLKLSAYLPIEVEGSSLVAIIFPYGLSIGKRGGAVK